MKENRKITVTDKKVFIVLFFFIFSLIGAILIPLVNVTVILPRLKQGVIHNEEHHSIVLATHLSKIFTIPNQTFLDDSITFGRLQRYIDTFDITKLRLFSKDGEILFSTDKDEVGVINTYDYFASIVSEGNVFSKLVRKNEMSMEGAKFGSDIVETYVPLMQGGNFIGALEIYQDVTTQVSYLETLINNITYLSVFISLVFAVGLSYLYVKLRKSSEEFEEIQDNLSAAQKTIADERARTNSIVSAIGDGISIQDRDFNIIYQNNKHIELAGSHVGERCYKAYGRKNDVCDGCPVKKTFEDGNIHFAQRSFPDLSLHVEITASPLMDSDGNIIAGIESVRDVTDRKIVEDEIKSSHATLKELVEERTNQLLQSQKMEAIGLMAGGIAHDFNNIIFSISGLSDIITRKTSDEEIKSYANLIIEASNKGGDLTTRLLTFSRKGRINKMPFDVNSSISEIKKLLDRVIGEDISLRIDVLPHASIINGDRAQFEQILMNLATNARDAMPYGGVISIETMLEDLDEDDDWLTGHAAAGKYIKVSFSDTGIGMDEKTRGHIFEPFYTTKEVGKGTGLGLSMVYGIVQHHNGIITVKSNPGKGTVFNILLPVIAVEVSKETPTAVQDDLAGAGETILVAEDDSLVRMVVKDILETSGYKVIEAKDGNNALQVFKEACNYVDLVLMDVVMPGMNGKEAMNKMRRVKKDINVLFMSGYTFDVIDRAGINGKQDEVLLKPIAPSTLLAKIRLMLGAAATKV